MLDDEKPINGLNEVESSKDLKEFNLRQTFHSLSMEEKMQILYESVLSNGAGIADSDRKLAFFEKTEKISVSTWFKKVLIIFLAFTGSVALLTFIFMIFKNGAFNDISVVASFFKTLNEVMNIIFLTK